MNPFQTSNGATAQINSKLFLAFICALAAWLIWPTNPQWWGFGLISIMLAAGAFLAFIDALQSMKKIYMRDKAMAEYMAQGNKPKSSKLASTDALRKAGVIHE